MLSQLSDFLQRKIIWESPERALALYKKAPKALIEWFRVANLRRTIELAGTKSIFYGELFARHPFELKTVGSPKDLFPIFTTERDLVTYPSQHFLCARADTAFESTGTASKTPKRIFFSNRELEDAGRIGAAGLWRLGVCASDRVVSSFDYSFWVSGPALKAALEGIGAFHIEAGRMDPKDFYDRVKPYHCNVIVADPGWLVRLSEVAEKEGPWPLKLMIAGGENLAENSRRYAENVWGAKLILSYGQTEAFGMIGVECPEQQGYHINDMDLWAEIPAPDKDGYGELVYTTLRRSVMPLIRYRSGDVTKLIHEPCRCGVSSPRLAKLKGRADDLAVTSVGNIAPWMFESAMDAAGLRSAEWQIKLSQAERRDTIEFHIEMSNGASAETLREKMLEGMKLELGVARQGILQGLAGFAVKIHAPGELKQGRKLKRILDQRTF